MSVAYDVPTPAGRPIRRTPATVLPFPRHDEVEDAASAQVDTQERQAVGTAPGVGLAPRVLVVRWETARVVAAVGVGVVAPAESELTPPAVRPEVGRRRVPTEIVDAPAIIRPVPNRVAESTGGAESTASARLRLTVRGRRVVAVVSAIALLAAVWITVTAVRGALSASLVPSSAPAVVTVHPGDTLWSIALRLAPERDPRAVIAALRARNHLASANVQAGQRLLVPR